MSLVAVLVNVFFYDFGCFGLPKTCVTESDTSSIRSCCWDVKWSIWNHTVHAMGRNHQPRFGGILVTLDSSTRVVYGRFMCRLSLSLSLCISLSLYLSIFLSFYLPIFLSFYLSIFQSFYLSIYLSIYPTIHIYPSIHLSIYPSIHLSIYPSIHLSIYLSTFIWQKISPPCHLPSGFSEEASLHGDSTFALQRDAWMEVKWLFTSLPKNPASYGNTRPS